MPQDASRGILGATRHHHTSSMEEAYTAAFAVGLGEREHPDPGHPHLLGKRVLPDGGPPSDYSRLRLECSSASAAEPGGPARFWRTTWPMPARDLQVGHLSGLCNNTLIGGQLAEISHPHAHTSSPHGRLQRTQKSILHKHRSLNAQVQD